MATTSEIQVTEAYIGLLGRAPDPAGLAYWAAQLDAAIAAGEDSAVALKKLTNDITLSDEWDSGIGANDASTKAGSEAIVTAMYNNLFDRTPPTQAELDYWAPKLVSGEFTASEMAVALIEGAGTTDGDVLGYKQQAATYYVESVSQDAFTRSSATSSVSAVNGPISLADSKTSTDYVASGVGETFALTTAATDAPAMTAGSDTVTGVAGTGETMQTGDSIVDSSSVDSDVLTITGDDEFDFGTVTGVETINVSIGKQLGGGFTVDADKAVGGTINFTVDDEVEVAGVTVTGETTLTVNNLASNLTTTNVTSLTTDLDADTVTITTDADATVVTVTAVDGGATAIVLGNESAVAVNIDGTADTNDVASITGQGTVVLDVSSTAQDVEYLTLAGGSNDVNFDITGVTTGSDMKYTTSGANTVTLTGAAADFSGATFVQGATTALDIDANGNLDLTGQGVFAGGIDISADLDQANITVQSGNTISFTASQTAANTLGIVSANDTTADSVTLSLSNDVQHITTTNIETVTIETGTGNRTIDQITATDNGAAVTAVGTGNIIVTTDADAGTLTVSGNDVTFSAGQISSTVGKVDIDAMDTATVAGGISANNGLTIDADDFAVGAGITVTNGDAALNATNDSNADAITVSAGSLTITGKAVDIGGNLAAQNDIDITTTGALDLNSFTTNTTGASGQNTIELSATSITASGAIGSATTRTVSIAASNDSVTSNLDGNITATKTISLTDGKFDATGITLDAEAVVISGDTDVLGAPAITAESVTITSTNDVVLGNLAETNNGEGIVLSAASASGAITAVFTGDGGSGTITAVTGSGNDTLTLNEVGVFSVNSGGGVDNVTITDVAASSVINTGEGDDVIDDDETVAITIATGGGNDSYTPVAGSTSTVDMGAGDGDKVVLGGITTSSTMTVDNYEILDISGGAASISTAQFNKDNSFEVTGANTLTVRGGGATAVTIDASNLTFDVAAVADLDITGSSKADTITGSSAVDVINGGDGNDIISAGGAADTITGAGGNDTLTGGSGADDFVYDATGTHGVDTITDFVSGTDDLDINNFSTTGAIGTHANVSQSAGAITLDDTNGGVAEMTGGTNNSTPTDFTNGTQVLAAVSNGTVNVDNADNFIMVLYSGGKAYIYLLAEGDNDGLINADEVTLVGILDGIADGGLAGGDFI